MYELQEEVREQRKYMSNWMSLYKMYHTQSRQRK